MARQRRRVDVRERDAVDPPWSSGVGRERSRAKHVEARDGKAFGARERETARAFAVAPAVARAGIEQHAHGCEVDGHARALEAISVAARRELAPTVDAAGGEMAPAAVIGNLQIGIGLARDVGHVGGNRREAARVEGEIRRAGLGHPAMYHGATLAHRGGVVELGEVRRRRIRFRSRRHSLRSRPTVPA
jgi:hypothetical protein